MPAIQKILTMYQNTNCYMYIVKHFNVIKISRLIFCNYNIYFDIMSCYMYNNFCINTCILVSIIIISLFTHCNTVNGMTMVHI